MADVASPGPGPWERLATRRRCRLLVAVQQALGDALDRRVPVARGGVAAGQDGEREAPVAVGDQGDLVDLPPRRLGGPSALEVDVPALRDRGGYPPPLVGHDVCHQAQGIAGVALGDEALQVVQEARLA